MIKNPYPDNILSRWRMFEWHKKFQDGCESVDDELCPGRPQIAWTDTKIFEINDLIENDRRIDKTWISYIVNSSYGSTQKIIYEDKLLEGRAYWNPKVTTDSE